MKDRYKTECSKCNGPMEDNRVGKYSYCKSCHNEYMRKNRKPYSEYTDEQKRKANARSLAKMHLRRQKIKKQPCEKCGDSNGQMHHTDYSKPLLITWLCRKCHLDEHGIKNQKVSPKKRIRNDYGAGRKHTCSKCKGPIEESRRGKYAYCKKCHANHMRNSRKISSPIPCS